MTRYNTLLLDQSAWDLVIDSSGNIARADPPYALAQDVASAVRLFLGELWFDTTKGVPYFGDILGKLPPIALIQSRLRDAALTVPGVVSAQVIIDSLTERKVTGQVQFIDENGASNGVTF
jgi:hypothetical protein